MPDDIEAIARQVFAALADPTRRAILAALASGGPATATDLAVDLPISRQAIAKHLALLAGAGLVTADCLRTTRPACSQGGHNPRTREHHG
jgi:DNA-binding transcriptional ArsR family regulator